MEAIPYQRHKDDRAAPKESNKVYFNDYKSDYYNHLLRLNLLHIVYTFELTDMFAIKSLKAPSSNFDMTKYSSFYCWIYYIHD